MLCIALSIATASNAQMPNAGFETWMSMGSYENPDGWATMNDLTTQAGVYTATKGTPGSPGNSYLKLTSKTVGPAVVNGIAVSGVLDPATQQPVSGFAYNGQPSALTGKWQHMIFGSSQGSISVLLTRWDSGMNMRMTVATGNVTLSGMAMSWANFNIPLTYQDSQAPDSCIIVLKASGSNPSDQDYLWVDNLAFSGNVAGLEELPQISGIQLFPNPAINTASISLKTEEPDSYSIEILNTAGSIIESKQVEVNGGQNTIPLDLSILQSGSYFISVTNGKSKSVLPLIIR